MTSKDPGISADLRSIMDRQVITDLIYRYCRSMDRIDAELGYTVWHDDATVDYGEELYQGSGHGLIDHACEQHRHTVGHSHQVTNIVIELDGDRAASESYITSVVRFMSGDTLKQITTWSRHIDRWSRRNARWAIDNRVAIRDFNDVTDATPMNVPSRATRDRNDPSYEVLRASP